jgi:hypothetical protein
MTIATTQLTAEEIVRLGEEIYYRDILPLIKPGNESRVVAVDVHSGEYEMADDVRTSTGRLRERVPTAEIFVIRVGYPTLNRIRRLGQPA